MRGNAGWVLVPALMLMAGKVSAQCTKDTDCKGDRVCEAGKCTAPATTPAAPPAPADTSAPPDAANPAAPVVGEALPPPAAVSDPPRANLDLPPQAPPSAPPPAPPPEPKTQRRSKTALVSGIVMVSAGPIALLGAAVASNSQKRCDDQLESEYPNRTLPASERFREDDCNKYSVPIYVLGIGGALLTAVGIPLIIYGAKNVPSTPPQGTLQIQPWATQASGGVRLRLTL